MNGIRGLLFFILLIFIFILIAILKATYEIWATSVTLKLFRNNQGNLSITRILNWITTILGITFVLIVLSNTRNKNRIRQ